LQHSGDNQQPCAHKKQQGTSTQVPNLVSTSTACCIHQELSQAHNRSKSHT
jgi:hypothetical protein